MGPGNSIAHTLRACTPAAFIDGIQLLALLYPRVLRITTKEKQIVRFYISIGVQFLGNAGEVGKDRAVLFTGANRPPFLLVVVGLTGVKKPPYLVAEVVGFDDVVDVIEVGVTVDVVGVGATLNVEVSELVVVDVTGLKNGTSLVDVLLVLKLLGLDVVDVDVDEGVTDVLLLLLLLVNDDVEVVVVVVEARDVDVVG